MQHTESYPDQGSDPFFLHWMCRVLTSGLPAKSLIGIGIYIYFFFNLFLAALGLYCCTRAFSSCSKQRLLSSSSEHVSPFGGFSCYRHVGSRAQARGCGPWAYLTHIVCGIFPDQGSNTCSLHWQADS